MKHKIKPYMQTTSDCGLYQQINRSPDFHAIHYSTSLQNQLLKARLFSKCTLPYNSNKGVHLSEIYLERLRVYLRDRAFTALTAAVAGSVVPSAGPLVARTTDT